MSDEALELTPREPAEFAREAGLRYVTESEPGIHRVRRGTGFSYHTSADRLVTSDKERARISELAIPPAWTDVWICSDSKGHIQATGRDAEGRKQYRYHPAWVEIRAHRKFHRMAAFGRTLPRIRRRVQRDLRHEGMPRRKVLAVLVRLLDLTGIRIGNPDSSRNDGSYGLTTLRRKHVDFTDGGARVSFRGKGGKDQEMGLADEKLARILQACYEIPGHELFQYQDEDGERHPVSAADVNAYIREAGDSDFTARDFRTWSGTIQLLEALSRLPAAEDEGVRREQLSEGFDLVADALGNTPAICREFYVHPVVVDTHMEGSLGAFLDKVKTDPVRGLRQAERRFLALLDQADGSGP
ncbi:MAG: DNA topoisomerase IB [Gemmatimonadales bacterium]|nr:MAG: DNA topoisomerase IB [Gemmatimonadales bacterium]